MKNIKEMQLKGLDLRTKGVESGMTEFWFGQWDELHILSKKMGKFTERKNIGK